MTDRVDLLLEQYQKQLSLPWRRDLSGAERVWIAVYPPELERRLGHRIDEFKLATIEADKAWRHKDLTSAFATWMAGQEHREAYFEEPELIAPALNSFAETLKADIGALLDADDVDDRTIVALSGVGSLFPMVRVSTLIQGLASDIRGRLLLFFPGAYEHGNYRLLEARDGWNYLAIPITIPEGAR